MSFWFIIPKRDVWFANLGTILLMGNAVLAMLKMVVKFVTLEIPLFACYVRMGITWTATMATVKNKQFRVLILFQNLKRMVFISMQLLC